MSKELFPIKRVTVLSVLSDIQDDPAKMQFESTLQAFSDKGLAKLANSLLEGIYRDDQLAAGNFRDGIVWMYRMIETQAKNSKIEMPRISHELASTTLRDSISTVLDSKMSITEFYDHTFQEMSAREPHLNLGFNEIVKYNPYGNLLKAGAGFTYKVTRDAYDIDRLRNDLGLE